MTVYPIQIIMMFLAIGIFMYHGYGLRYICLFMLPFYSLALLNIKIVTTYIQPVHFVASLLIVWVIALKKPLRKDVIQTVAILFSPFIVTLLYNYFFFTPVEVWEIEGSKRQGWNKFVLKESLSMTNVTQLVYFVFALVLFWIYSSIDLEIKKLKKVVDLALYAVAYVGIFQFVSYYAGLHDLYKLFFYNLDLGMVNQMFIWNIKRINSTFQEPSYMGHFLFFTHLFYLLAFGYKKFLSSFAVIISFLVGVVSTTTTFYLGALLLLALSYIKYSTEEQKMFYYVGFAMLIPFVADNLYDIIIQYIEAKETSSNERFYVSWTLAWDGIIKSPFFGFGYGTSRPLFVYTQILFSIGYIGFIVFIYGLFQGKVTEKMKIYLLMSFLIGCGSFELIKAEMWVYYGLLANINLMRQRQ